MIKFIVKYILAQKKRFSVYCFVSLLLLFINLYTPYLEGYFIDGIVYEPNIDFLIKIAILIGIVSVINIFLTYIKKMSIIKLNTTVSFEISNDLLNHIKKIEMKHLFKHDPVYLSQRINNDVNEIVSFCLANTIELISSILTVIVTIYLLLKFYGIIFMLSLIIVVPIYIYIYILFKSKIYKKKLINLEEQSKFFGTFTGVFKELKSIKINSLFLESETTLKKSFLSLFQSIILLNKTSTIYFSINNFMNFFLHIIIIFFVGVQIINGDLQIGDFIIISSYSSKIIDSISYFLSFGEGIQGIRASYERINEFKNVEEEINGKVQLNSIDKIEIKDLKFSYTEETSVLNMGSYLFEKGKIYGIIGSNGVGKSTLIEVLVGIFNSSFIGGITYNDIDIKKIDMYEVRKNLISVVEQVPFVNSDTIYKSHNIALERIEFMISGFNLEECNQKIEKVEHNNFTAFSGGEKQKISIINAIIGEQELLIFDEPTSAMDAESIEFLGQVLKNNKENKIIILISHNEKIIEICDESYVL